MHTQEELDAKTRDLHWTEVVRLYETLQREESVHMLPYRKQLNFAWKFINGDSIKQDILRPDYPQLYQLYKAKKAAWTKPYDGLPPAGWGSDNGNMNVQDARGLQRLVNYSMPGDPDHQWNYATWFTNDGSRFFIEQYELRLNRIYTPETWRTLVPEKARILIGHLQEIENQHIKQAKEYIEKLARSQPLDDIAWATYKHLRGTEPMGYRMIIDSIEREVMAQWLYARYLQNLPEVIHPKPF